MTSLNNSFTCQGKRAISQFFSIIFIIHILHQRIEFVSIFLSNENNNSDRKTGDIFLLLSLYSILGLYPPSVNFHCNTLSVSKFLHVRFYGKYVSLIFYLIILCKSPLKYLL